MNGRRSIDFWGVEELRGGLNWPCCSHHLVECWLSKPGGLDRWDADKCIPLGPGWISSPLIQGLIMQPRTRTRDDLGTACHGKEPPWCVAEERRVVQGRSG